MTIDDAKQALEQLKNTGYSEEDIVKTLYLMYADGKMSLSDLRTLTELMGYEFTEEFEAMSEEDKKRNGLEINYDFFDKASLPEAAETFASMMDIPVDIAKGFLNDGLQEGRTYCETVKKYRAGDIISFDEAKTEVKKLEASGMTKQDISDKAFESFKNDEISLTDLRVSFAVCGFEFTPEFEALSLEDKKKDGCVLD